jgi:molecular chaperone DnaK
VPAETKTPVEEALADLKAALAKTGDDAPSVEDLNAKVTKLNEESQKMGSAIYAAAQAEQAAGDAGAGAGAPGAGEQGGTAGAGHAHGSSAGDDDVVDAEVVDDDEPKK